MTSQVSIDWPQALAWRLQRHLLEPVGTEAVAGVVGRLGAVPATPDTGAELAIRARCRASRPGDVGRALADGSIIKTFAFRGAIHLMAPEDAGVYLALRLAGRMWELPSWQAYYGLQPSDWPDFRATVRAALDDGPLTREELGAAVTADPRYGHLGFAFTDQNWTLLKPLAWHGDMSLGPARGRATFQRLDRNPRWAGIPDLDVAGPAAIEAYLRVYGPATTGNIGYWLGEGLGAGRRRLQAWTAALADRLVEIEVGDATCLLSRDDVDELAATAPTTAFRLLPGFDQWVLGPGTSDPNVVPPARRALVTRGANIAILGGVVSGTWSIRDGGISIDWFAEAGRPPDDAIAGEVARLSTLVDQTLQISVRIS